MSFAEKAAQAIRDSGGRVTSQRRAVIDVLAEASDSLDAETVHQRAAQADSNINLATVYRILNTLEEAALIRQRYISKDHDRKVYDIVRGRPIYHFTCRVCGQTFPFETAVVDALTEQLAARGLTVESACMCVSGLCAACAADAPELTHDAQLKLHANPTHSHS